MKNKFMFACAILFNLNCMASDKPDGHRDDSRVEVEIDSDTAELSTDQETWFKELYGEFKQSSSVAEQSERNTDAAAGIRAFVASAKSADESEDETGSVVPLVAAVAVASSAASESAARDSSLCGQHCPLVAATTDHFNRLGKAPVSGIASTSPARPLSPVQLSGVLPESG